MQLNGGTAIGKYVAAVLERNLELLSGVPNPNSSSEPEGNTYNLCAKAMRHLFKERPESSCAKKNARHNRCGRCSTLNKLYVLVSQSKSRFMIITNRFAALSRLESCRELCRGPLYLSIRHYRGCYFGAEP